MSSLIDRASYALENGLHAKSRVEGEFSMRITLATVAIATAAVSIWSTIAVSGQQMAEHCPWHAQNMKAHAPAASGSHADMLARGEHAMGFNQVTTSHHFRLWRTGGAIEVHVNGAQPADLKAAVAGHLRSIAVQFSQGDFSIPRQVHGETPAGAEALKGVAGAVTYAFEPGDLGGRILLVGKNEKAVAAIHEFLRYQIREHRTGDRLTIE